MSWFRVPARSLFLANLGAAVLAGLGSQTLQRMMGRPVAWRGFALRCALILAILIAALWAIDRTPGSIIGARTVLAARHVIRDGGFQFTVGALVAILAIGSFRFSARNPKLAAGLIALLVMAELGREGHSVSSGHDERDEMRPVWIAIAGDRWRCLAAAPRRAVPLKPRSRSPGSTRTARGRSPRHAARCR